MMKNLRLKYFKTMIIALDLETTWLDNKVDRILEIWLVKFDEKTFEIAEQKSFLVNPEIDIPVLISNICNIWQDDIKDCPLWKNLIFEIEDFIWDFPILWHNIKFDTGFLRNNWIELRNNLEIDTFELSNFLLIEEKSFSLESLSTSLWLELEWAHRALNDTLASIKLFKLLLDRIKNMSSKQKVFYEFIANNSVDKNLEFVYKNILWNKLIPISNDAFLKEFLKTFPSKPKNLKINIDSEIDLIWIEDFIKNNPELELRENQAKMSNYVKTSLEKEEKIVIEAPTWVWKTFAYLLPSIINSIKTWEQVFVSTSTKALQDQIFYKDLEFLSKKLEIDFSYCKLKWKANYISISSFINFINSIWSFDRVESVFILKILFWLYKTKTWELDELDYFGKEFLFLNEINANDVFTFSKENTFINYEFAVNARKNAKKSNIVIINNNILFQDIEWDNSILWKVENLVLDEAHTLEDVVTSSFKKWFGLKEFEKNLINLEKILNKKKFSIWWIWKKADILIFEMWIIFDTFRLYLNKNIRSDDKYQTLLIKDDFYDDLLDGVDKKELSNLILLKITDFIDWLSTVPDEVYLSIWRELKYLEDVLKTIKILLDKQDKNKYIKIITYNEKRWEIILEYTLLNVWEYLETKLWSKLNSCIITSATLKIWESFNYINNILNLEGFSFKELESDFDYSKQALLFIPDDLGSIKNNLEFVIEFLRDLFLVTKWNTLVLFTAFYAIKETYSKIAVRLKKEKINLYAQSIWWWKHKLIEAFKKNANNSILIWTDTFWEGIDIPWDDLKYLIIHKVPFMVPTDPIFQARSNLFKNAFMEYWVPKSILKLKQWFWRLIRTKTDTWIVIFLDDRIYSTKWWEVFYSAFPKDIKIRRWASEDFINILKKKKG
jgi:predicted DnaQ family exonuclease/DinG family helicase